MTAKNDMFTRDGVEFVKSTDMTLTELLESLDGEEQEAIEDAYGMSFQMLATQYPNRLGYGLVWIVQRRHNALITLKMTKKAFTIKTLDEFFAEEDPMDSMEPENPVSESGKD